MLKNHYKKKWCKYGDNCKYANCAYLCKFAHYPEEKKRIKFKKPVISLANNREYFQYDETGQWQNKPPRQTINIYDSKIPEELVIFYSNMVGLVQVLTLISNDDGINNLIMSYMMSCRNKRYIKTLDKCNRCYNAFSYKYEQDDIMHQNRVGLRLRNNPFYCAEYRKTCNIGPLCYTCALYKIPIRCDVCCSYTNANNMEFNYDITKDIEIIELFTKCAGQHYTGELCTNKIKPKACNICTVCLFEYYDSVMPCMLTHCHNCLEDYNDVINTRFGSAVRKTQLGYYFCY